MNGKWIMAVVVGAGLSVTCVAFAEEHGGQEHGGQEHGGQEHGGMTTPPAAATEEPVAVESEPSAEDIRQAIRDYVEEVEEEENAFTIEDEATGATRTLTLDRVHERVGKTGDYYYSCTDMRDQDSGETLDLDFDMEHYEGDLEVVDVRIHKVNGQPRYTYDDQSNRVPVTP